MAKTLADELRAIRGKISQEDMAHRFGVTLRTYQRWEKGRGVKQYHVAHARTLTATKKRGA